MRNCERVRHRHAATEVGSTRASRRQTSAFQVARNGPRRVEKSAARSQCKLECIGIARHAQLRATRGRCSQATCETTSYFAPAFFFLPAAASGGASPSNVGPDAALDHAVADADELEDRAGASIAEAGLGEAEDARVAAGPIGEPRGDFVEQHARRLACRPAAAGSGGGRRRTGRWPGSTRATCRSCATTSRHRCRDRRWCRIRRPLLRPARPLRAIVMHFSTSGRTSFALEIVVMMRPFTFGLFSSYSASRSVRNSALARLRSSAADGWGYGRVFGLVVDVA